MYIASHGVSIECILAINRQGYLWEKQQRCCQILGPELYCKHVLQITLAALNGTPVCRRIQEHRITQLLSELSWDQSLYSHVVFALWLPCSIKLQLKMFHRTPPLPLPPLNTHTHTYMHTHTYTHMHIYIYIYILACDRVSKMRLDTIYAGTNLMTRDGNELYFSQGYKIALNTHVECEYILIQNCYHK